MQNSLNGETVSSNYPGGTNGYGGSGAEAGGGGGFIPMEEMVLRQRGRSFLMELSVVTRLQELMVGMGGFGGGGGGKYKDGNLYGSLHDGGGGWIFRWWRRS